MEPIYALVAPHEGSALLWAVAFTSPGALIAAIEASRAQDVSIKTLPAEAPTSLVRSTNIDDSVEGDLPEWREVELLERSRRNAAAVSLVLFGVPSAILLFATLFHVKNESAAIVGGPALHICAIACVCSGIVADVVSVAFAVRTLRAVALSRQFNAELELLSVSDSLALNSRLLGVSS